MSKQTKQKIATMELDLLKAMEEIKEFKKRIKGVEDCTKVQCSDGNWNYDRYMHGMANGMILCLHLMKGEEDDPKYKKAPEEWICDKPDDGKPPLEAVCSETTCECSSEAGVDEKDSPS